MRGRILQYNGTDGSGIIVADGQQYRFTIATWKGDTAPAVGKVVEIVVADGQTQAVMLVADDVLVREKTAELAGKLNTLVGGIGGTLAQGGGASAVGGSVIERYGVPLLVAYGVFLLGTLVFNAISIEFFGTSQGKPLYDIATLLSQFGGASGIKTALLFAYASIAVPLVWRDRRGWLALLLPLLAVVWALWSGYNAVHSASNAMGGATYGRQMASEMSNAFSFGFGFYLSVASALVLATGGAKRFLSAA